MNMMKILIYITTFYLFVCSFSQYTSAEMQKPQLSVGDYWEYKLTLYFINDTYSSTGIFKIEEITTIIIDNIEYEVFKQSGSFNLTSSNNLDYLELNFIHYYGTLDNAEVKKIIDSPQMGQEEYTYSPPTRINYPLKVGKSWQTTTTEKKFLQDVITSEVIIINFECLTEREITVPAGKFNCYVLKEWENDEKQNYTISYRSPETGAFVKSEVYSGNELFSTYILHSYRYSLGQPEPNINNDGSTSGFELIITIIAVALILFWKQKRKL